MKKIIALILCFSNIVAFSQQNLKVDYKPIRSQGILPQSFTRAVKETVEHEIADLKNVDDTNARIKSDLLVVSNYAIDWEIKSGNTLINDEITAYLSSIVDIILKNQPELRKKIQVYASKSTVVNAVTFYNGTIFMDLGLIAHAENEAQLAYALCHEIIHYNKQHHIQGWIHNDSLETSLEGKTSEDVFKEKCNFSKDQESEADSLGFYMYKETNYSQQQAVEMFEMLRYADLPFELVEFNKSFFETTSFRIPDKYQLQVLAPVKNDSTEDDSESTHPNTLKRKETIQRMVDANSKGVEFKLDQNRFNYVRELAQFEMCRLFLRYRDYNAALYSAYSLSKKYPDNLFLMQTISKCLYAISLNHTGYLRYNKDSYLDGPIHYLEVESYPQQLYYLINKLPDSQWNILSLNYVFRKHLKFPNDKMLSALSDSLLKSMFYVNASFETGGKNIFVNENPNPDTTSWTKNVFADLFANNQEFIDKFPKTIGHDFVMPYTPKSYHKNRFAQKSRTVENIGIVMCLKPLYLIYNYDGKEVRTNYLEAETQQKILLQTINDCAEKQNFKLVILDPGMIDSTEVVKLNDYSIVTDWLIECSDGDENEKSRVPIFSADELQDVVKRYGTSHVLRTGFAILNGKVKEYVFFAVIYDLTENRQVYIKQELFKGKPSKSFAQDKICALFDELKFGN